jgi:hypothetical protein
MLLWTDENLFHGQDVGSVGTRSERVDDFDLRMISNLVP